MMVALERRDGISLTRARVRVNPPRQAEKTAAIASPTADSVTLDIWVPGTVASRSAGSAATSCSAEPLARPRSPTTTRTGMVTNRPDERRVGQKGVRRVVYGGRGR